jgi:RNA ligase
MKKFDINILNKYIEEKWIFKQSHPTLDLHIYNYSQFTQYEKHWDEITLACRGLILDSEGNVIARGFNKFFNSSEHDSPNLSDLPLSLPFTVTEKMDGSLLIVFKYKGEIICASRGSFTSEQAVWGSEIILQEKRDCFSEGFTYLFELIVPENRIVVDYGDKRDVVLLGIVETETGKQVAYDQLAGAMTDDFEIVKQLDGVNDFEKIKDLIKDDKEGYVITFSNGVKCKIKGDSYLLKHKFITELSTLTLWEFAKNNLDLKDFISNYDVPDEYFKLITSVFNDFKIKFKQIKEEVLNLYKLYKNIDDRKVFAKVILKREKKYSKFLFLLRDNNLESFNELLWKNIKPEFKKLHNYKIYN